MDNNEKTEIVLLGVCPKCKKDQPAVFATFTKECAFCGESLLTNSDKDTKTHNQKK